MRDDLNRITLVGNIEFVIEDSKRLSFKMSTKEALKNAITGERVEIFEHHMVACADELVNMLKGSIFKGVRVFVDGAVRTRLSNDEEDKQIKSFEIAASFVEVLKDEEDTD